MVFMWEIEGLELRTEAFVSVEIGRGRVGGCVALDDAP